MGRDNFKDLKAKYDEGYRCIYKDKQEGLTLQLKNFTTEKLHTIQSKSDMEIGEIEGFLEKLDKITKETGTDCHGTEKSF